MGSIEYKYYKAAGESLRVCLEIDAVFDRINKNWREFQKKYNAQGVVHTGLRLSGLVMDDMPEGWRVDKQNRKWRVPDCRRKAGKEIQKYLDSDEMKGIDGFEISKRIGVGPTYVLGAMHYTVIERYGDIRIIRVPVDPSEKWGDPKDAIPLKVSEYWTIKEQDAAKGNQ